MSDLDLLALSDLAKVKTTESRHALLNRVVDIRTVREEKLRDRERQIIDDILLDLTQQAELELRAQLATQLSNLPNPPEALVEYLINDASEVAVPLLKDCAGISNDSLIKVIRTQSEAHRLAIAGRNKLGAEVSGTLIEVGEEVVLGALIENETAEIDTNGMQTLVRKSQTIESLQRPLLERKDIDPVFANQMFWWVSGSLRQKILEDFPIDEGILDNALEIAVNLGADAVSFDADYARRAEVLRRAGAVRIDNLINLVRRGDIKGLVAQLIQELGVSRAVVRDALTDQGGHALALLCKAIGASRDQFTTLFLLIDYQRNKKPRPASDLQDIARIFDGVSEEQAINTLCFWEMETSMVA